MTTGQQWSRLNLLVMKEIASPAVPTSLAMHQTFLPHMILTGIYMAHGDLIPLQIDYQLFQTETNSRMLSK